MALVYKSVCFETDSLLVQMTHLVEKEIKYKLEMEKLMNKGFVNIAKARYIMGSTCVTKMQLPSENSNPIQPIVTVCRAELNNHWVFHIHRKDVSKSTDKKNLFNEDEPDDDGEKSNDMWKKITNFSEEDFKYALQSDPKALRKSKQAFHVNDKTYQEHNEELLDEFSHSGSEESLHNLTDPVRLFGVLVPNTLKHAQEIFIEVVNLLGKCATIQSELRENLSRYNHLLKVKALMENAAADAEINLTKPKVYWTPYEESTTSVYSSSVPEENQEYSSGTEVNVTKSIRSVFYDLRELVSEEVEWPREISESTEDLFDAQEVE